MYTEENLKEKYDECEFYKYQQVLNRQLSYGDFLKVELRKTMALMMR